MPFLGFINSPSTEFNILNPSKKNIGYTKEKIITEVEKSKNKIMTRKELELK